MQKGVYILANAGPNSKKLEIHINGKFRCMSFPGGLTPVKNVKVGDIITGIIPGLFNKKVLFEFILTENEVDMNYNY